MLGAAAERICIDAHKTCTQKRRAVGLARCDRFVGRGFALDHDILIVELVADRGRFQKERTENGEAASDVFILKSAVAVKSAFDRLRVHGFQFLLFSSGVFARYRTIFVIAQEYAASCRIETFCRHFQIRI